MSDRNIKFEKVPYLDPKKYFLEIRKSLGIYFSKDLKVGEEVVIELPPEDVKYSLYYLGETPEEYSVDGSKLTVTMPKTMLVFVRRDPANILRFRIEFYIAS